MGSFFLILYLGYGLFYSGKHAETVEVKDGYDVAVNCLFLAGTAILWPIHKGYSERNQNDK